MIQKQEILLLNTASAPGKEDPGTASGWHAWPTEVIIRWFGDGTRSNQSDASKKAFEPMRATLHWEPCLHFENGQARFEYYTSDHSVPCRIIMEGLYGIEKQPLTITRYKRTQ